MVILKKTVDGLFLMVEAITRTGILPSISHGMYGWFGSQLLTVAMVMLVGVALASGFLANIPVVAAMILVEEGRLALNDPVSRFLPSFEKTTVLVPPPPGAVPGSAVSVVPAKRLITVRDLLTHTAGLSYGAGGAEPLYKAAGLHGWYFSDKTEFKLVHAEGGPDFQITDWFSTGVGVGFTKRRCRVPIWTRDRRLLCKWAIPRRRRGKSRCQRLVVPASIRPTSPRPARPTSTRRLRRTT